MPSNPDYFNAPLPEPLFGCAYQYCQDEVTWPAEDIKWCEAHKFGDEDVPAGWYCDPCCHNAHNHGDAFRLRVTLAEEIKRRNLGKWTLVL